MTTTFTGHLAHVARTIGVAVAFFRLPVALVACGTSGDERPSGPAKDAASPVDAPAADGALTDGPKPDGPDYDPHPVDGSACGAVVQAHPILPAPHVSACWPLAYDANPPTSGPHFAAWPKWKSYAVPVPRGYLLHGNEHGAVTIHYNCPGGCPSEVAAAEAFVAALPKDPACATPPPLRRVVLVPDPLLDVRWAASSWGFNLRATCFDTPAFAQFLADHYAKAPEDFCDEGSYVEGDPKGCGDGGED